MELHLHKYLLLLLSVILLFACSSEEEMPPEIDTDRAVIEQMLDIAEENSINKLTLDWTMVDMTVLARYDAAGFDAAVLALLQELGDNHSSYFAVDGARIGFSTVSCDQDIFLNAIIEEQIGYVSVSAFVGTQAEGERFAENIQRDIARQDVPGLKGWIIDLTTNSGGNMYPMVAGLGPILGPGIHGYFLSPDGVETPWGYTENGSYAGSQTNIILRVRSSYTVLDPDLKIAVITDGRTASSGEATAISFLGRPNTLFIGRPTCGLSTANVAYELSNGGQFILTVATMADRNKTPFGNQIIPDIETTDEQMIASEIVAWMNED